MKKVVIIDGQGGRLGQLIAEGIINSKIQCDLYGIGTNTAATAAMIKAGVKNAATGENPIIVACRDADVIVGPIAITSADSLLGEITPNMAVAVGQSKAIKLLLPVSHCNNLVVGTNDLNMNEMVDAAVEQLKRL
ncbi:MAG: DUF3842 family protein [Lachnospiraceae bacterium]|nr:DUF3842 family protein [Lachnospiraceae bacterium]